ncbi:MAG: Fe-S cluster assembly protein SufD [Deltaproteobacteria bacterium]|nr:Fe-S cluster assembly protein SufD [Deltaproteobacteria bacterium]
MKTNLEKIFKSQAEASHAWQQDFRLAGLKSFETQGLPTTKQEDWKYTSVKSLAETEFKLFEGAQEEASIKEDTLIQEEHYQLTLVGGIYQPKLSKLEGLPKGVQLLPLSQALQSEGDFLKEHLAKSLDARQRPFVALNEAFLNEGLFLKIEDHVVLDKAIEFCHVALSNGLASMSHPRILISLGKNAQATFIEHYTSVAGTQASWTNVASEFLLAEGSLLHHVRLQEESEANFYLNSSMTTLDQDARFNSFTFDLGAGLNRQEIIASIEAPGAHVALKGLYLARDRQHTDFQTLIHHRKPYGTSQELFKGILSDRAHGVFNGQIIVDPHAQKTASELTNKNLMLSREAEVDTKPLLKIFADDVKCSHGATIGRLDEDQLFYFQSRGIDSHLAKHLLTYAFAAELLSDLPWESLTAPLTRKLKSCLNLKDEVA